jgi:uncharacterized protein YidB (DUF937 family)
MGLLDVLNGMQQGPRGPKQPGAGGGMSPMTMALLGLLAYKALKSFGGGAATQAQPGALPPGGPPPSQAGGLGDLLGGLLGRGPAGAGQPATLPRGAAPQPGGLGGLLGNLLGGGSSADPRAGTILSSGLGTLIRDLQATGHGQAAQSWIGHGPNEGISPDSLEKAVGADTLDALSQQTGMQREDLLAGLSRYLPDMVDQLTPEGKLPSAEEARRMV